MPNEKRAGLGPNAKTASRSQAVPQLFERNCSVGRTISIMSDAWSFLVIREAFFGARRFEQFRTALGLPRGTLAERLKRLTVRGIFRQVHYSANSSRAEYHLTRCGMELYPSFVALIRFGDRWLSGPEGPPLKLIHATCGQECEPYVACSHCLGEVKANRVRYRDGPGAGRTPVEPAKRARRTAESSSFSRGRPSSVSRSLEIIGDRWSFLILREAFFGVRRFDQMQTELRIAPNILTERLGRLVTRGVFDRVKYQDLPERYEYRLTEMGKDLYGAFITMGAWGDRWLSAGDPPLVLTHLDCGHDFSAVVVCNKCRKPIEAPDMRYRLNYDPALYGAPQAGDRIVEILVSGEDAPAQDVPSQGRATQDKAQPGKRAAPRRGRPRTATS
ncbi:helix-turn-helix transcriptional regulator [Xanthobacter autotrophicus]|uniref:winged helix-turn-helix transcriptional regulator n=1 Tax=Xanthobacter autotrophicus TaxID=280 RepID=UPI001E5E8101|nr:helix-turn-helix domain-containing protein [Xanthobacter autotrophicus]UDQ88670.1 helix-turn-helix transcriptional regulator [Xanthobacter autotrophicus]